MTPPGNDRCVGIVWKRKRNRQLKWICLVHEGPQQFVIAKSIPQGRMFLMDELLMVERRRKLV